VNNQRPKIDWSRFDTLSRIRVVASDYDANNVTLQATHCRATTLQEQRQFGYAETSFLPMEGCDVLKFDRSVSKTDLAALSVVEWRQQLVAFDATSLCKNWMAVAFKCARSSSPAAEFRRFENRAFRELGSQFREFIGLLPNQDVLQQVIGAHYDAPRLPTTTRDGNGIPPGIHLDSIEGASLYVRTNSQLRVGVNLGPGTRWFVFSPIDIAKIATDLLAVTHQELFAPTIAELETLAGTQMPFYSLKLLPGTGYVFPTDAFFHDGCTLASSEGSFVYFSRFDLKADLRAEEHEPSALRS
jgi:hypothetical protein